MHMDASRLSQWIPALADRSRSIFGIYMGKSAAWTCSSIPRLTAPTDALWMPMTRAMLLNVIPTREQLDQHHASNKATDMSPERDSTGCADGLQSSKKLNHHPIDEHHP